MVRIFVPTVPLTAAQVWAYATRALTDKVGFQITEAWEPYLDMALSKAGQLTEQNTLKVLFFKRAETLGTDLADGAGVVVHGLKSVGEPLYTDLQTDNVTSHSAGSAGYHSIARAARMPSGGFGGKLVFEGRSRLVQVNACAYMIGLGDAGILAVGNEQAYFYYMASVGPNWRSCTNHAGPGPEDKDTGVAADTNYHVFRIVITGAGVNFYIDGVLVQTHTGSIPDQGLDHEADEVAVSVRTEEDAIKHAFHEYVALWIEAA